MQQLVLETLSFVLGLVVLVLGAEALVRGASTVALRVGLRPIIIGVTVVAFGTSLPELFVSLVAVLRGSNDLSLGNVVGSNTANIALILGLAAVVRPIPFDRKELVPQVAFLLATSLGFYLLCLDRVLGLVDGLVLLFAFGAFTWYCVRAAAVEVPTTSESKDRAVGGWFKPLAMTTGGICLLPLGAHFMVTAAVAVGQRLGISEAVLGITVVAVGTSLPELATSMVAAWRKEAAISLGNVVGSNIFNVVCVLGLVATIGGLIGKPMDIAPVFLAEDAPIMLTFTAILILAVLFTTRLSRTLGVFLLLGYLLYNLHLFGLTF